MTANLLNIFFDVNKLTIAMVVEVSIGQGININSPPSFNLNLLFNESDILSTATQAGRQNWSAADCAAAATQVLGITVNSTKGA